MSERPDDFQKAVNFLKRHGYDEIVEYIEQLEGGSTTSEPEPEPEDDSEADDSESEDEESFVDGFTRAAADGDVSDYTVSQIEDGIGDVEDSAVIVAAFEADSRTTARDVYSDRYEELTGSTLEGDE